MVVPFDSLLGRPLLDVPTRLFEMGPGQRQEFGFQVPLFVGDQGVLVLGECLLVATNRRSMCLQRLLMRL